jgi:hypothetical protein
LKERSKSLERALEDAVSRALRDNLGPLQRTADELHQAYADLVAACSSSRPSNALPAMLRAQTAASALAAGLSVLSNFVAVALNPRDVPGADVAAAATAVDETEVEAEVETEVEAEEVAAPPAPAHVPAARQPAAHEPPAPELESDEGPSPAAVEAAIRDEVPITEPEDEEAPAPAPAAATHAAVQLDEPAAPAEAEAPAFDIATLSSELQDLHRRANRVAKVAMQDIKLLRPKDVRLGREQKDLCHRLRNDLDKARKEYDRRFRAIQDHPVDYFHHWLVEILAEGDPNALGDYPYPSPVLPSARGR